MSMSLEDVNGKRDESLKDVESTSKESRLEKDNRKSKHNEPALKDVKSTLMKSKLKGDNRKTEHGKHLHQAVLDFSSGSMSSLKKGLVVRPKPERRKRSIIWKLVHVSKEDPSVHVCDICGEHIYANFNTTNSRHHLETNHPKKWKVASRLRNKDDELIAVETSESDASDAEVKPNGKRKQTLLKSMVKYGRQHPKKLKHDRNLTRMIAENFEPFAIVERPAFRRFVSGFDPRYCLPDRTTISKILLPKLFAECGDKLKERLRASKYLAITLDAWTSTANTAYLSVTGHFICRDTNMTELESVTLGLLNCQHIEHSAKKYAEAITEQILNKFELVENDVTITCATTDNAAVMIATCRELNLKRVSCYSHTLQLVVEDVLFPSLRRKKSVCNPGHDDTVIEEDIYIFSEDDILLEEMGAMILLESGEADGREVLRVVAKCKRIASFFHRSANANALLAKECFLRGVNYYRLVQCVRTRWNSVYLLMKRILQCTDAIDFVLVKLKKVDEVVPLDAAEITVVQEIISCLQPFVEATSELGGDKYVSVSLVIPNVGILLNSLSSIRTTLQTRGGQTVCRSLITRAEKRLLPYEEQSVCAFASILDPRIKDNTAFKNKNMYGAQLAILKSEISTLIKKKTTYEAVYSSQETSSSNNSTSTSVSNERNKENAGKFAKYTEFLAKTSTATTVLMTTATNATASATIQLNDYLSEPRVRFEDLESPLVFWSKYRECELREIAFKYLIACATSNPSERVNSSAGNTITHRRTSLNPETAEELVFVNKNSYLLDLK